MAVHNVGNWVEGEEFWGRENEINIIKKRIKEQSNILIQAPRRMGKTSLIHEISNQIKDSHVCIHIDVQQCNDLNDIGNKFINEIYNRIEIKPSFLSRIKNFFSNALSKIRSVKTNDYEISIDHKDNNDTFIFMMNDLFLELSQKGEVKPVVLFIDEMPQAIENFLAKKDGEEISRILLSLLRLNLQENQGRVQAVFAGSIGFEPILNQIHQTHQINHLNRFFLKGWKKNEAVDFLMHMAIKDNLNLSVSHAELIIKNLGDTIPYHVQIVYQDLHDKCYIHQKKIIDEEIIGKTFTDQNLPNQFSDYASMETRLSKRLKGKELALAHDILNECAIHGCIGNNDVKKLIKKNGLDGSKDIVAIKSVFFMLQHDWYLKFDSENKMEFATPMFRRWWNSNFIPLSNLEMMDNDNEEYYEISPGM